MILNTETEVAILGAGPSGLAAAMELGLRGVHCLVVEPRTSVNSTRPRAKTTSVRTMEHFRRWGITGEIRAQAPLPVAWSQDAVFCTNLLGYEITRFHECFGLVPRREGLFAESGQQIPQPVVESVLRKAAGELNSIAFAYGYRATTINETDSHVDVRIRRDDEVERHVRAQYVLGCDGGTSITREAIGARYVGGSDSRKNRSFVFRAPGLAEQVPHGPAVHYWTMNSEVSGVLGRLDLVDTWFATVGGDDADESTSPAHLLRGMVGADVDSELVSTDHWTARMLLADRFASERIFLVGDAAHLNPPWGGHGFNTGVGDAVNIGWKLSAVLAGWGGRGLLDSYEHERKMVARHTIDVSSSHLRQMPIDLANPTLMMRGPAGEAARATAAQQIQDRKKSEFHSLGLVLGYHYSGSPVVAADHETPPHTSTDDLARYQPTARAGARLPHAWLPDGTSLYDQLGADYTLLRLSPDTDPTPFVRAAAATGVPLTVLDSHEWLDADAYGAPLVLVRPDQHVAWRGGSNQPRPNNLFDLVRGASID